MRIFISYGHDERAHFARRLKTDLEARGHSVWFDETGIRHGQDWEVSIERGLATAEVVLALMTPHAVRRPDGVCLDELSVARFQHKRILPLMVAACQPPLSIARLQWLDVQDAVDSDVRYRSRLAQIVEALERRDGCFEGTQSRLQDELRPLDFTADIGSGVRRFSGREWLLRDIDAWLAADGAPPVYFLTGAPGIGKSALAAWICHRHPAVAAHHFCCHGHTDKADPLKCVTSLAYQLAAQFPAYRDALLGLQLDDVHRKNARTAFDELIVQPLGKLDPPGHRVLIVIDGLSEATITSGNELVEMVAEGFDRTPDWVRLIVTSRPDPDVLGSLARLAPHSMDAVREENARDIRDHVIRELRRITGARPAVDIVEGIVQRSEGIFLYVTLLLEELARGQLTVESLDRFPHGLAGIYAQLFRRSFPDPRAFQEHQRPLLELVAAAREPLPVDEACQLLGWDDYRQGEVLTSLGSLFTWADGRLRPFHRSMLEWLAQTELAGAFMVSPARGHQRLVEGLWRACSSSADRLSAYGLEHLPGHVIELARAWPPDRRIQLGGHLVNLLSSVEFLRAKLARMGIHALQADFDAALSARAMWAAEDRVVLECLARALSRRAHVLRADPELLEAELANALRDLGAGRPRVLDLASNLASHARRAGGRPWLERIRSIASGAGTAELSTFDGHEDAVTSVAFSADGVVLASGSADRTVRIREAASGRPRLSLAGHARAVTCVACAPDGARIVSGSEDRTARVWDAREGRVLLELKGHGRSVTCAAYSADGQRIVTGSNDRTLRIWDAGSGRQHAVVEGFDAAVTCVVFSVDGGKVVAGALDGSVRVCEVGSRSLGDRWPVDEAGVTCLAISPDGRRLVVGGRSRMLRLLDPDSGRVLATLAGHGRAVTGVAFSPAGDRLVSGSEDKSIRVWDVASGRELAVLAGHVDPVNAVAFSPDGSRIASGSHDRTVKIWDAGQCVSSRRLPGHADRISAAAQAPDGRHVVTSSHDRTLKVWDSTTGDEVATLAGHIGSVTSVAVSSAGDRIVSGSADRSVRVWAGMVGSPLTVLEGHEDWVRCVAFSPDGHRIASGSNDRTVRLWDVLGGGLATFVGHEDAVTCVDFSPDGGRLVSGGNDRTVRVWDVRGGPRTVLPAQPQVLTCVAFAPDGGRIASATWDGALAVSDARDGRPLAASPGGGSAVRCLAWSPDARWLVVGRRDRILAVHSASDLGVVASAELGGSTLIGRFGGTGERLFAVDDGGASLRPGFHVLALVIPPG